MRPSASSRVSLKVIYGEPGCVKAEPAGGGRAYSFKIAETEITERK